MTLFRKHVDHWVKMQNEFSISKFHVTFIFYFSIVFLSSIMFFLMKDEKIIVSFLLRWVVYVIAMISWLQKVLCKIYMLINHHLNTICHCITYILFNKDVGRGEEGLIWKIVESIWDAHICRQIIMDAWG